MISCIGAQQCHPNCIAYLSIEQWVLYGECFIQHGKASDSLYVHTRAKCTYTTAIIAQRVHIFTYTSPYIIGANRSTMMSYSLSVFLCMYMRMRSVLILKAMRVDSIIVPFCFIFLRKPVHYRGYSY